MSDLYRLYGAEFSLYSGKVRSYLRKKGINFEETTSTVDVYRKFIIPRTGVRYIPVVQTPDDQVIQDTTEIIDELEARFPDHSVYPETPKQRLASLLLEVYADEWLVIPAMHYRWNYPATNADFIYREFGSMAAPKMPGFIQKILGKRIGSKFKGFVPKLGIVAENINAIEQSYVALLSELQTHFEQHDFLFGSKPSIGDFGLIAPLYAHLFRDPAPGKLMRKKAPAVCDWVRRMNSDDTYLTSGEFLADDQIPETLISVLRRMANEQLPVLQDTDTLLNQWRSENPDVEEVPRMIGMHKFSVEGVEAQRAVVPYSLWMFQRPVAFYQSLSEVSEVDQLLNQVGFGDALKSKLQNPLIRQNNKLVFA